MVFSPPKTARSRRQVTLSPTAALALRAHQEQRQALHAAIGTRSGDLVFCRVDGSPLRPDTATHAFGDLVHKAELPHVGLHNLRHTHATLMMEQGVNPKVVRERLGHPSVGITLDLYSHVSLTLQADAALRFDQALREQAVAKEPAAR